EAIAERPDGAAARVVLRPVEHVAQRGQLNWRLLLSGNIVGGRLGRHRQLDAPPGGICGRIRAHGCLRSLLAGEGIAGLRSAVWPTVWGSLGGAGIRQVVESVASVERLRSARRARPSN